VLGEQHPRAVGQRGNIVLCAVGVDASPASHRAANMRHESVQT